MKHLDSQHSFNQSRVCNPYMGYTPANEKETLEMESYRDFTRVPKMIIIFFFQFHPSYLGVANEYLENKVNGLHICLMREHGPRKNIFLHFQQGNSWMDRLRDSPSRRDARLQRIIIKHTVDSRSNASAYKKKPYSNNIFVCPLGVFSFIIYNGYNNISL